MATEEKAALYPSDMDVDLESGGSGDEDWSGEVAALKGPPEKTGRLLAQFFVCCSFLRTISRFYPGNFSSRRATGIEFKSLLNQELHVGTGPKVSMGRTT